MSHLNYFLALENFFSPLDGEVVVELLGCFKPETVEFFFSPEAAGDPDDAVVVADPLVLESFSGVADGELTLLPPVKFPPLGFFRTDGLLRPEGDATLVPLVLVVGDVVVVEVFLLAAGVGFVVVSFFVVLGEYVPMRDGDAVLAVLAPEDFLVESTFTGSLNPDLGVVFGVLTGVGFESLAFDAVSLVKSTLVCALEARDDLGVGVVEVLLLTGVESRGVLDAVAFGSPLGESGSDSVRFGLFNDTLGSVLGLSTCSAVGSFGDMTASVATSVLTLSF
jgi:hypothetical protein